MRRLCLLICLLAGGGGAAAEARAASQPPILYDAGLRCPGIQTGVGSCSGAKYDARIYEIAKIGFPAHALTSGAYDDTYPTWSPNHTRIAFYRSTRATGGPTTLTGLAAGTTIWLMNADGSGQKKLKTGVTLAGEGGPTWSPDGKRIVFTGASPDGKTTDLYSIETSGTGLVELTANPDGTRSDYPSWSPDGTQILFRHLLTGGAGGFPATWTIAPDGTGAKKLFLGGIMYAWRPDGKGFAYVRSEAQARNEIVVANADGTGATQLTSGSTYSEPSWSPNAAQIVLVRANQITVIDANGTGVKQLTRRNPLDFFENPDW